MMPSLPPPQSVDVSVPAPGDGAAPWVPEVELAEAIDGAGSGHADRLAAIGALAGGVAHDFNNLLTVILGSAASLRAQLPPDSDAHGELEEIELAAERGARLTRELLHGREDIAAPRADAGAVLDGVTTLLRRAAGDRVSLRAECAPALWPAAASPGDVERVLVNLVVNARDALPGGGTIAVTARNAELDAARAPACGVRPGRYVRLAVADDGHGMDARTAARALEPLFTTKGAEGAGLGLSTVGAIARRAGGSVTIASRPGAGTTVAVHVPAARR